MTTRPNLVKYCVIAAELQHWFVLNMVCSKSFKYTIVPVRNSVFKTQPVEANTFIKLIIPEEGTCRNHRCFTMAIDFNRWPAIFTT